jgi:hypothetical protein
MSEGLGLCLAAAQLDAGVVSLSGTQFSRLKCWEARRIEDEKENELA